MKFKVGDKIRVLPIDPDQNWTNGTKLKGQIGIISEFFEGVGIPIAVSFDRKSLESLLGDSYGGYTYHFKENEIEPAVAIGEQLLFSFMSDVNSTQDEQ